MAFVAGAAVLFGATLVLVAAPRAAGAQEAATTPPLLVVEQSTWIASGGTFQLLLDAPTASDEHTLTVTVHDAVGSRSAFARSLTGEQLGDVAVAAVEQAPLGFLSRDTGDTISIALGPDVVDQLDGSGVYPVDVTLAAPDGTVVHRLVTHLVRVPGSTEPPPLRVAVVLPIDASPALQPDGTTVVLPEDLTALQLAADVLTDHPDLALTVDPEPETIAALAGADDAPLADLLEQMAQGVQGRQVLGGTYADLDVTAWVDSALAGGPLADQVTAGTAAIDQHLGVRADRRSWMAPGATTPATLSRQAELGVDQVVLPESALLPLDAGTFPVALTQPFELLTDAGELQRAAAADTVLGQHLGSTGDAVLDAQHLLADLAVLYFDRPALDRGVPVVLPSDTQLPPAFVDTLLTGLQQPQRVLGAVTLDDLFAEVPDAGAGGEADTSGNPLIRSLVPTVPVDLGDYPDELALTELTLQGYRSLVGTEHPMLADFDRLTLASADQTLDAAGRSAYLAEVSVGIDATIAAIRAPQDQTITLTSRTGTIPLRLRNDNAFPVEVVVDLESERLDFPEGEQLRTALPPGETQLDVRVETRASGAFTLEARVGSPDGIIELTETEYKVRSTALSGVGVVLSVGAGLILLVWWARHFRNLRRNRALVSAVDGHPSEGARPQSDPGSEGNDPEGTPDPDPEVEPDPEVGLER
jgi:hypothetical protein